MDAKVSSEKLLKELSYRENHFKSKIKTLRVERDKISALEEQDEIDIKISMYHECIGMIKLFKSDIHRLVKEEVD